MNAKQLAHQLKEAAYTCGYEDAHPSNATTRQAKADTKMREILETLYAKIERLEKDAARYRWLKHNPQWLGWEHDFSPDEVEREVDAAMRDEKTPR